MKVEEKVIALSGYEVAARVWGEPTGRPVLAMHGWLDNAASFDGLLPLMAEGFFIVALDLPGHGRSGAPGAGHAYHFIDWVAPLIEVVDRLGWERFSILGHSMGAAIAAILAPVIGERVERMVFLDGIGPWSMEPDEVVRQLKKALTQEQALRAKGPSQYSSLEEVAEALRRARRDVAKERLLPMARRAVKKTEEGFVFDFDRRLLASSRIRLTEAQVLAFLGAIACPVLLVRPKQGWPVGEEMIRARTEAIADLRLIEVDGGHHVHLEAPERVAEAVAAFLRGDSPGSSSG